MTAADHIAPIQKRVDRMVARADATLAAAIALRDARAAREAAQAGSIAEQKRAWAARMTVKDVLDLAL